MKLYPNKLVLLLTLAGVLNFIAPAQIRERKFCPDKAVVATPVVAETSFAEPIPPKEKAIATDAKPTVSICVMEGSVTIRGWQRKEVRAMVEGGGLGFIVVKRTPENAPAWLKIVGFDPKETPKPGMARQRECLSGEDIEIEVPYGSYVDVKSPKDASFKVESVARTRISNLNGDVLLRDIREEADVSSLAGNVVAEDSTGKLKLSSTSGNVYGIRLKPLNDFDTLVVKSESGNVTLQDVLHADINGRSSNNNLNYFGSIVPGGVYNFNTVGGAINLFLPLKSSFQLNATTNGIFHCGIAGFKPTVEKNKQGQPVRFTGVYNNGESTINLVSVGGALRIQNSR